MTGDSRSGIGNTARETSDTDATNIGHPARTMRRLAAVACWSAFILLWNRSATTPPLDVAMPLSGSRSVTAEFDLPFQDNFDLYLSFPRQELSEDQRDFVRGSAFCTEKDCNSDSIIPVNWSLYRSYDGMLAGHGEVETAGGNLFSSNDISRKVGSIKVPSERYRIEVTIPREIPALHGASARIRVRLLLKHGSSWNFALGFWGLIITVYLVWPYAALQVLYTLLRLAPRRTRAADQSSSRSELSDS